MQSNASNRIDALPSGTRLHAYVIESVLGHGGFGIVYLACHFELGGRVAIKEYLPSVLATRRESSVHPMSTARAEHYDEGLRRFLEEARQLVRFESHPSVVSCRDFFRQNGTAYLVMEYVDGLTLADLLQRREQQDRPFDESELMAIARPLVEGLLAVHAAGVLHRDIKPANIVVRRSDDRPVLIDFGAAKHCMAGHSSSMAPYTEGYAANEQISEGGQLGPWTDLYGLGGVLWRIVAGGNPPWEDPRWSGLNWRPPNPLRVELRMRALGRGQADPLPSAREVGKGRFSNGTLTGVDRCLEVWEEDRVQDCSQLLELLRRDRSGVESSTAVTAHRDEPTRPVNQQQRLERDARRPSQRALPRPRKARGIKHTCQCGSVAGWWTGLPLVIRLTAAWVKWVLGLVMACSVFTFVSFFGLALLSTVLLELLGVSMDSEAWFVGLGVAASGLALAFALWITKKPKVCRQCGCVSSRMWE